MNDLPALKTGHKISLDLDTPRNGKGFITIVQPNGYITLQQEYLRG